MATEAQLALLGKGVTTWNQWRRDNCDAGIDLSGANLSKVYLPSANFNGANLAGADLSSAHLLEASLLGARLTGAHLFETNLSKASLRGADLTEATAGGANLFAADLAGANLRGADLSEAILLGTTLMAADLRNADLRRAELGAADLVDADLSGASLAEADLSKATLRRATLAGANLADSTLRGADLRGADLTGADLHSADLRGADLRDANLTGSDLSCCVAGGSDFSGATLTGCRIYAMSSWGAKLDGAAQQALHITPRQETDIAVDTLQVAQFVALWLADEAMSEVFGTVAKQMVLILGRFAGERETMLNSLCADLRRRHYLPLVLDFGTNQVGAELKATIAKLTRLARFVVVDITGAASAWPLLVKAIPEMQRVVWQPMIPASAVEPTPFEDLLSFPWVRVPCRYWDVDGLLSESRGVDDCLN